MRRGQRRRPGEWLAEKGIFLVSLSAIVMVFLIFLFVARESLPLLLGRVDASAARTPMTMAQLNALPAPELAKLLDLEASELATMQRSEPETVQLLIEAKFDEIAALPVGALAKFLLIGA